MAIALRNRMRRQKLPPDIAEEIMPKNIIMIGPTGVGKTEIARRLAKLTNSPFLKVEASKFTEVGYVGRDVESMIRDLVEIAIDMVREEKLEEVADKAEMQRRRAPARPVAAAASAAACGKPAEACAGRFSGGGTPTARAKNCASNSAKASSTSAWWNWKCANAIYPAFEIISNQGVEEMDINIKDMLPNIFGRRTKKRKMKVGEAFEYLVQEEEQRLIDMDQVTRTAVERVENSAASSSSMKSTRSPAAKAATAPTSRAKACSATSCPSSKAPP